MRLKNLKFVIGREENIAGIGQNPDNQYFLLLQQCSIFNHIILRFNKPEKDGF